MNKNEVKHLIWTSNLDYDDEKEYLESEYPEPDYSEDDRIRIMYENNNDRLDDERKNLSDITYENGIVVIAYLNLWWGKPSGYKEIESGKLTDCLCSKYEPEWFVDEHGDLRCNDAHHDGTNHYLYREWKDNISDEDKETFLSNIYKGLVDEQAIEKLTQRLGDPIGAVYGWDYTGTPVVRR